MDIANRDIKLKTIENEIKNIKNNLKKNGNYNQNLVKQNNNQINQLNLIYDYLAKLLENESLSGEKKNNDIKSIKQDMKKISRAITIIKNDIQ
mgnify:CR=1 FL=1